MAKADYTYSINQHNGKPLILIIDKDLGGLSVTNDIENVVAEICEKRSIECKEAIILFQDSQKLWDGYDCKTKDFIPLHGDTWQEALSRL